MFPNPEFHHFESFCVFSENYKNISKVRKFLALRDYWLGQEQGFHPKEPPLTKPT